MVKSRRWHDALQVHREKTSAVASTARRSPSCRKADLRRTNGRRHAYASIAVEGRQTRCSQAKAMRACRKWRFGISEGSSSTVRHSRRLLPPTTNSYKPPSSRIRSPSQSCLLAPQSLGLPAGFRCIRASLAPSGSSSVRPIQAANPYLAFGGYDDGLALDGHREPHGPWAALG